MSALGACSAAPPASPVAPAVSAEPAAAAAENTGASSAADAGGGTQSASDSSSGTTSFQKLMSQAQTPEPARAGTAAVATAPDAPPNVADAAAAAAATLEAADPLTQLLQLAGQSTGAANTAATASLPPGAARQINSDSDADAAPQEDPLALVLAALAQIGVTLQPAAPVAPAAAATVGTALAVATESAAAPLSSALPTALTNFADGIATRLRPGAANALPAAANGDSTASAASTSLMQLEPATSNITLRDLLDGSGGDAARARDPVELAATARPDGTGLLAAANDNTRTADSVTRTISIPVQHPRWADAVSNEIRWFAEQGVQGATLRLTPEHLGPVEVRLSMADNQVTVNFSAASAETRTALEQSLPRLREMLAGAGLSLGEAQVQQQMRQGSQNGFNSGGAAADTDVRDTLVRVPTRLGLVDEYA